MLYNRTKTWRVQEVDKLTELVYAQIDTMKTDSISIASTGNDLFSAILVEGIKLDNLKGEQPSKLQNKSKDKWCA